MTYQTLLLWGAFNLFVIAMLALDLGVFHRKAHEVRIREALFWSVFWIVLSMLFNLGVYYWHGSQAALEFLTGYLLEKSLSVDNIFVFLMIFTYFRVPYLHQHKVLFWGILGALIMRALFILVGITLIQRFHWVIYIMGAFLIITGIKMATQKDADIHPERNPVLRLIRRFVRVTEDYEGDELLCEAQRAAAGHAVIHRRAGGRDDRCHLRGGFHPRHPGDHARPLHRLYLERLCDSRAPGAVFRPGRGHAALPLSPLRPVVHPGVRGSQDVAGRYLQSSDQHGVGDGCRCAGDLGDRVDLIPAEARSHRHQTRPTSGHGPLSPAPATNDLEVRS